MGDQCNFQFPLKNASSGSAEYCYLGGNLQWTNVFPPLDLFSFKWAANPLTQNPFAHANAYKSIYNTTRPFNQCISVWSGALMGSWFDITHILKVLLGILKSSSRSFSWKCSWKFSLWLNLVHLSRTVNNQIYRNLHETNFMHVCGFLLPFIWWSKTLCSKSTTERIAQLVL